MITIATCLTYTLFLYFWRWYEDAGVIWYSNIQKKYSTCLNLRKNHDILVFMYIYCDYKLFHSIDHASNGKPLARYFSLITFYSIHKKSLYKRTLLTSVLKCTRLRFEKVLYYRNFQNGEEFDMRDYQI